MIEKITPHFAYQLHFASGDIEKEVHTKDDHKQFLTALYGGRTKKKEFAFDVSKGVDMEKLRHLRRSRLLSEEVRLFAETSLEYRSPIWRRELIRTWSQELEYYAWEFARHGLRGPRMLTPLNKPHLSTNTPNK